MKTEKSKYDTQAEKFLADNTIKFRATLTDSKPAPWQDENKESGHHYRVTLSKPHIQSPSLPNGTHLNRYASRIVFDFWGSIADQRAGEN